MEYGDEYKVDGKFIFESRIMQYGLKKILKMMEVKRKYLAIIHPNSDNTNKEQHFIIYYKDSIAYQTLEDPNGDKN